MKRPISILEAIYSLKPEYRNIVVSSENDDPDAASTTITWSSATPISNSDIKTEQARIQNLEDNCYHPRRVGTATTSGYSPISDQLDQLYRDVNAGKFGNDAKTGEWFVGITSVKTKFPKS